MKSHSQSSLDAKQYWKGYLHSTKLMNELKNKKKSDTRVELNNDNIHFISSEISLCACALSKYWNTALP